MISFALLAVTLFRFFGGERRFGVIAVYRLMCHEYRKQNQLNPVSCLAPEQPPPLMWKDMLHSDRNSCQVQPRTNNHEQYSQITFKNDSL